MNAPLGGTRPEGAVRELNTRFACGVRRLERWLDLRVICVLGLASPLSSLDTLVTLSLTDSILGTQVIEAL
jgi:hypothetical protein